MYRRAVVIPIRTDTDPQLRSVNGKIIRTWFARTAARLLNPDIIKRKLRAVRPDALTRRTMIRAGSASFSVTTLAARPVTSRAFQSLLTESAILGSRVSARCLRSKT
jgi:hypothetical protein